MPVEKYSLMDGKLHVYKRERSSVWQCSTFMGGINHRASTKEKNLAQAKEFALDWYMELFGAERRRKRGLPALLNESVQHPVGTDAPADRRRRRTSTLPTFEKASQVFYDEYRIATEGERNPAYVLQKQQQLDRHLIPFFGKLHVDEITAGKIQQYRTKRLTPAPHHQTGKPHKPARNTLHSEMVTLRQVLKSANRHGWISSLPDMTTAYKSSGKKDHRAWFSPEEYKALYTETRERTKVPRQARHQVLWENLHDYVLFMGNTGLRPDEASRLQERDVKIVEDQATGQRILEIEVVDGKRGVGYCKSMPGAVHPFQRVRQRKELKATDLVFGKTPTQLLNTVLGDLKLKTDRDGNPRTAYSLRHTYICMRLMEGADIYQIAKNCRTSVEMIEKYYASHIKNTLDTTAINVRKSKPARKVIKRKATKAKSQGARA